MAVRAHHVVERDLQHDFWLDQQPHALILNRVLQEPLRHLGDFNVGEAGISFPDIQQPVAVAHRECVIAQNADPLPVTVFHGSSDHIQRSQFALEFEPRFPSPSWAVRRGGIFNHQSFIAAGLGCFEELIEFLR